ncbi:S9 family peptidase [Streptoalloteichus hindustanus]|uniref:Dipeptidyl aminopeptidase/acylaminoacyl peptidase n=1 Tax=Streptoalloteichus hindustanus TaxID=2017 RepID=A0A1M4Y5C2_STRHI|nr:DPP IV N-terminal domain-containing protein [Streptoalloteichus hindustanus]SHF00869.1 Dipeptidyl aminopeptidase/acylaminoacyl peptidase [Streptoalloteichus hindustanus]
MRQLDPRAYEAAEKLMPHHRHTLVSRDRISPVWTDGGAGFWYRADKRFVLVDPAAGTRRPAFDHQRLAEALATASGQDVDAAALPFAAIELAADGVEFAARGGYWRCRLDTYEVEPAQPGPAVDFVELASPDRRHAIFRRDHDLWVRRLADGQEWALTTDGEQDLDYATSPDWWQYSVLVNKLGFPTMPPAAAWSPDGTRVLTHRTDQRGVRRTHRVEALPADGGPARLHTQRYNHTGDERLPLAELVVLDITTGAVVNAQAEPLLMSVVSPVSIRRAWWAADGTAVYFLRQSRDGRALSLERMDPTTGRVDTVVTETGDTRVEPNQWSEGQPPMVAVLSGGSEVLWYSQRDGWGHLYRYDATGALKGRVTSGDWAVREILHVDEERGLVYFTASGLVAEDPYRRSVCRVGMDGSGFVRLTDDDLDHAVTVAPNGAYFVDSASTHDTPPVTTVRDWAGKITVELERADISGLLATGWNPPERFRVKAADGVTDVYGVLYKPHGFDPALRYPVIDHPYPGPQTNRVHPTFDPGFYGQEAEGLAALGFVVVAVDGRGTPGRDKAFSDASFGNIGAASDQVAALRQLAETRPWMDMDRVGVMGNSAGGHQAVRAMLDHPEFYRVGVASCAPHDLRYVHAEFPERYHGMLDEVDYELVSNVDRADRLQGKLLLVHGGMDPNVLVDHTLRLAERLVSLDKDVETLILPGAEHLFLGYEHHLFRRRWDFLVRNLMGVEPPEHRIAPVAFNWEVLAAWF